MLDLLVSTVALFRGPKDERTVFSTAAAPVSEALNEKTGARSRLCCELAICGVVDVDRAWPLLLLNSVTCFLRVFNALSLN